ncbi:MAG: acylneuraminate cytidylyltransferase family protein [Elusimicrobia bacterium]|nr:acylneuraminate cytidylyltransferase family protein [Elusimicrobiota bacterium]
MSRVIAVIPARGGSKGIPRKNLRPLGGKPLIAYSIEQGRAADLVDRVIVSTDDPEIAAVACQWGAETPFLRPAELAQDNTPDLPVHQHLLQWFNEHEGGVPEALVVLRPTCPIRPAGLIDRVVQQLFETGADSVRTGYNVGHVHPYWMLKLQEEDRAVPFLEGFSAETHYQRQMLPPLYRHNGVVDALRSAVLLSALSERPNAMYGKDMRLVIMPEHGFVNIDSYFDFKMAEILLAEGESS